MFWRKTKQSDKRQPGEIIEFHGWISANKKDRGKLHYLGVRGRMVWRKSDNSKKFPPACQSKTGIFEFCTITLDIVDLLIKEFPAFHPGTFTAIRADGVQTLDQPLWKMGHDMWENSND